MPHADPEKRREYNRNWRRKHAEQERERQRKRYRANAAAICARTSQYAKSEEAKALRKVKREELLAERRVLISEYKATRGCVICGESHPACLDFHHVDPHEKQRHGKASTISSIMRKASLERLMSEIAKCVVLCANCHRKAHADMGWEWTHRIAADDSEVTT